MLMSAIIRLQMIVFAAFYGNVRSFSRPSKPSSCHRTKAVYAGDQRDETMFDESDWRKYQKTSPLKQKFEGAGGILYKTSVFSPEDHAAILHDVSLLAHFMSAETSSSVAVKRVGAPILPDSKTMKLFREGSLLSFLHRVVGDEYELAEDIPVEARVYEQVGSGMVWHVDDVLYDPPQIEAVFTVENNSDCRTMWKENDKLVQVETDDNSVVLLRAGGVSHCVSSLKRGRRVIIKCAFVEKGAQKVEQVVRQFENPRKKPRKNHKRKSG